MTTPPYRIPQGVTIPRHLRLTAVGVVEAEPFVSAFTKVIDRADNTINICEVKYSEDLYSLDKDEFLKIQNRIKAFKDVTGTRSSIIPTMITTFGMKDGMYSDHIIAKIDMDDLFHS